MFTFNLHDKSLSCILITKMKCFPEKNHIKITENSVQNKDTNYYTNNLTVKPLKPVKSIFTNYCIIILYNSTIHS